MDDVAHVGEHGSAGGGAVDLEGGEALMEWGGLDEAGEGAQGGVGH